MKNKLTAFGAVAGFILSLATAPAADTTTKSSSSLSGSGGLGKIEAGHKLIGREIQTSQHENLGKVDDFVVDLESGHILYALVTLPDGRVAVPPQIFSETGEGKPLIVQTDKQKFTSAPHFTSEIEKDLSSANFSADVYRYFGQAAWWEGASQPTGRSSFGNVHKASALSSMTVKDTSDHTLGKVSDVTLDLADGRIPFVLLTLNNVPAASQVLYPLPPNALTAGSDASSLVTGLDQQKLQSGPNIQSKNWAQLSTSSFASSVYQYYGKQPYWGSGAGSPTGRSQ